MAIHDQVNRVHKQLHLNRVILTSPILANGDATVQLFAKRSGWSILSQSFQLPPFRSSSKYSNLPSYLIETAFGQKCMVDGHQTGGRHLQPFPSGHLPRDRGGYCLR